MQVVPLDLGERSYDIEIAPNSLNRVGVAVASLGSVSRTVLMTDEVVEPLYAETATESIVDRGMDVDVVVVPAGEETKSVDMACELWNRFLEMKIDRRSVVVALGGGVVGDLAGFVAATYARGIRFFQVPTTFLAQIDSSVGGKTAVDLPSAKNMVGAFHQPSGVLVDPNVLKTLPVEQYRAGLGEAIKYGASLDGDFFAFLEKNANQIDERDPLTLERIVARCCQIKAEIVQQDEKDLTGRRALLNYGHTFGHALETAIGYGKLLHGTGVALGCVLAGELARRFAQTGDSKFRDFDFESQARQRDLVARLGSPTNLASLPNFLKEKIELDPDRLIELMSTDKKSEFGKLNLVLPTGLGRCELVRDVPVEIVRDVLIDSSRDETK